MTRRAAALVVLAGVLPVGGGCHRATVPAGAPAPWAELTEAQRAEHMQQVVLPRLGGELHAFDAARFPAPGCPTCHGRGVEDGSYAMPNPELPHLDPSGFYRKHRKQNHDITDFMWRVVEPTTAELLGVPRGKRGVHCGTCHVRDG
jgi:hypothetical protein